MERFKPARRKTWAFFTVQLLCAFSAYKYGVSWPLTVLAGGVFLAYTGAVSTEKVLLAWIEKGGGKES